MHCPAKADMKLLRKQIMIFEECLLLTTWPQVCAVLGAGK